MGPLTLVISYFVECNYMYTLREKICSAYPVFSLFLLLYTGNCCGYVNRIYDSEGGTGLAHCSQSHSLDLNFDEICYVFCCSSRHGLFYCSVCEETCKCY